jgi:CheY-like chemotaxis protein
VGAGRGSVLVARLRAPAAPPPSPDAARPGDRPAPAVTRVLVVEHNPDIATSLSPWLTSVGKEAMVASDGLEALEQAERYRPDAILLDLGLPGMDGFEVCREIRALPEGRAILVIAVTGWGRPEDRARTTEAGFDAHLVKPVDYSALLRLLSVPAEGSTSESRADAASA